MIGDVFEGVSGMSGIHHPTRRFTLALPNAKFA
jgi:hypothetical protein